MNKEFFSLSENKGSDFVRKDMPRLVLRFDGTKEIAEESAAEILKDLRQKLDEGFAVEAEKLAVQTLQNFLLSANQKTDLVCLLSLSLELQGRFTESFGFLQEFSAGDILDKIDFEGKTNFTVRLAVAHAYENDFSTAADLLNVILKTAEKKRDTKLLTEIYNALSLVYCESGEFSASRNFAEKAMKYARENGDWHNLARAYRLMATGWHKQGNFQKSLDNLGTAIQIVGENPVPLFKSKLFSDIAALHSALSRPQEAIFNLKKVVTFFEEKNLKFLLATAYNNLGVNLTTVGNFPGAEDFFESALQITAEIKHADAPYFLNSFGELKMAQGKNQEAFVLFEQAAALAEKDGEDFYAAEARLNSAQIYLAENQPDKAIFEAENALRLISTAKGRILLQDKIFVVLSEAFLRKNDAEQAEEFLAEIEDKDNSENYLLLAEIARLRGQLALTAGLSDIAVQHFNQSLSLFEMTGNMRKTALAKFRLAETLGTKQRETSIKHLSDALDIFRRLQLAENAERCEKLIEELNDVNYPRPRHQSASSQLLMLRLAEAVASRELLMRELVTILRQESRASKILLAETGRDEKLFPYIIDGFTPNESAELLAKYQEADFRNDTEDFAKQKNLAVFRLRAPSAPSAVLIISPAGGALLDNGSPIQPLLRVVELGMDVCALREKDKESAGEKSVSAFTSQSLMPGFIHSSPEMTRLVEEVHKIRSSDVTVLITGESGTGKELVSRAIHAVSRRKDKAFVPFNCTAVPKELTEGHLFGYKRGAFTGAVNDSPGMIRAADGGTLFLDEIGDLPLDVQPKILRFLQEGEVQPLGEKSPVKVDVRIIAATNMDIEEKIAQGLFREDLFYRLNVVRLRVPPLRERRSEIPQIVSYYLNHYSAKFGRENLAITPQAMDLLIAFDWLGNVRQLCNEIQRIVARADDGERITLHQLSAEIKSAATQNLVDLSKNVRAIGLPGNSFHIQTEGGSLESAVTALEKQMIQDAMKRHNNNISRVAKELGLTRRGLYMKIERYKLGKTG